MTKIYSPELTVRIFAAIKSITLANNGYADIGNNAEVADAVQAAGFIVLRSNNLHGAPTFIGSTSAAQRALAASPFGVSTYKAFTPAAEPPDYEGALLARAERLMANA